MEAAEAIQACGGHPAARQPVHITSAALAHGLLGTGQEAIWQARALEISRVDDAMDAPWLASAAAFVDARLTLRSLESGTATATVAQAVERAFAEFTEPWWVPYARAAGAELAVVAGFHDAEQ